MEETYSGTRSLCLSQMHVEHLMKPGLTLGWCNKKGRWSQVTYECKKCERTQSSSFCTSGKTVQWTCLACTLTPIPLSLTPPVTSLAVLQAHTAKGTCSQSLAATPRTCHNPLFGYKSFKICQRSRALISHLGPGWAGPEWTELAFNKSSEKPPTCYKTSLYYRAVPFPL